MSVQKEKYLFPSKDDFLSFYYYKSYINRKIESYKEKNPSPKKEIKLRNWSTKNKIKSKNLVKNNFSLNNILLCLSICGKKCKMEDHKYRRIPTPIEGLNCDKIDDFLFASQRLTNKVINQFDLINKLKELNIGLIVNCEMKGEHPYCGDPYYDGLDICGFAYSTELLEKNGINVLLCGWNDLSIPDSFNHLIKIIKKMHYYISTLNKRIIVHCHAGFGRTAIVLACYYIFTKKVNAEKARKLIRKGGRSRCLGSHIQFNYCREFAKYLEIIKENFFEKNKKDVTIFKINENMLNIGNYKFNYFEENNNSKYVPIFILYIFDRIIQIKNEKNLNENNLFNLLLDNNISKEEDIKIKNLIKEINDYKWEEVYKCEELKILNFLLFKWMKNSIKYTLNPKVVLKIDEKNFNNKCLNEQEKTIINCICKFLSLIIDNKSEINGRENEFLEKFIPSLLGYLPEDIKNDHEKNTNYIKLKNFFQNIIKQNYNQNKND